MCGKRTDVKNEIVWLAQESIALLFDINQSVISCHINNIFRKGKLDKNTSMQKIHISNIFREKELDEKQTVAKNATVQTCSSKNKTVHRTVF